MTSNHKIIIVFDGVTKVEYGPDGDVDGFNSWSDCDDTNANIYPGNPEICDGLDNDCSGVADDNLTAAPTTLQKGVCAGTLQTCTGAGGWIDDYSTIPGYETTETTCDGLDNDCDGVVDIGCDRATEPNNEPPLATPVALPDVTINDISCDPDWFRIATNASTYLTVTPTTAPTGLSLTLYDDTLNVVRSAGVETFATAVKPNSSYYLEVVNTSYSCGYYAITLSGTTP